MLPIDPAVGELNPVSSDVIVALQYISISEKHPGYRSDQVAGPAPASNDGLGDADVVENIAKFASALGYTEPELPPGLSDAERAAQLADAQWDRIIAYRQEEANKERAAKADKLKAKQAGATASASASASAPAAVATASLWIKMIRTPEGYSKSLLKKAVD